MKKTTSVISVLLALLMIFSLTAVAGNGNGNGGGNGGGNAALALESATIDGTPIAEATEIRSNAEILLTFTANVTDDSVLAFNLGKIKVLDGAGSIPSTVTIAKSGTKKITVSLGGVEKAAYTLTIGKEFKDTNGNTLGTKVEIPFTVTKGDGSGSGGGNNPLTFGGATVNDTALSGATLKGNETITLQFDRGMKTYETDNAALITVKKADGSNASYTVLPVDDSNDTTKQQIKVQLGGLEDGDYTLTIGKNLKANNGNTLGTKVEINFTVKGASDEEPTNNGSNKLSSIFDILLKYLKMVIDFFKGLFTK